MIYEILEGGAVVNTIVADADYMLANYTEGAYRPAAVQPPPPAPEPRRVTVGAFFDRFGANKWPILADTNPLVQALIKDCSVRSWINLDDAQLVAGLSMLAAAGHSIDPSQIVSAPVQVSERP